METILNYDTVKERERPKQHYNIVVVSVGTKMAVPGIGKQKRKNRWE